MLAHTQIAEMKSADIRSADKYALPDMSGYDFDNTLPREERAKRILEKIQNPYLFRFDDMAIKVEFTDGGPALQDLMASFLLRQKCGV